MPGPTCIIRQDGEGERLAFAGGGLFTMKASAAETGGAFILLEDVVVRDKVTPLHLHPGEDETLYVLDGEIVVFVDGEDHPVGRGGVVVFPRGVAHAFKVVSDTARLLAFQTPGTGEAFYREISDPAGPDEDGSRPADFDRLRRAAERSPTIELLGPPPWTPDAP